MSWKWYRMMIYCWQQQLVTCIFKKRFENSLKGLKIIKSFHESTLSYMELQEVTWIGNNLKIH